MGKDDDGDPPNKETKLSLVTTTNKIENKYQVILDKYRQNLEYIIEFNRLNAIVRKANYDALIEAGFTEGQAINLC